MHQYRKILFPARREAWFVGWHRRRGHKLSHLNSSRIGCYWVCGCGKEYWC